MSSLNNGLRLCLLGRFELRAGERLLIDRGWRRTRSKALLKLLWPHLEPAAAANQLYKSLHYPRAELARGGVTTPVVAAGEELVELADAVWVDVDEFRARARAAREQKAPALYEQALEVYAGDLLTRSS